MHVVKMMLDKVHDGFQLGGVILQSCNSLLWGRGILGFCWPSSFWSLLMTYCENGVILRWEYWIASYV